MVTIIDNKAIASTTSSGQQASGSPAPVVPGGTTGGGNPSVAPAAPASSANSNPDVRALTQSAINGDAKAAAQLQGMGVTDLNGYASKLGITKVPASPLTAPQSAPGVPSSSATAVLNANGQNAVTTASNPPAAPSGTPSANEQAFMDAYGVDLATVRATYGTDAKGSMALAQVVKPILDQRKSDEDVKAQAEADKAALAADTALKNAQEDENG